MKRFVNAHSLLDDLDAALLPSGKAFTHEERTNTLRPQMQAQSQAVKKDINRTFDRFIWVNVGLSSARRRVGQSRWLAAQ